MLCFDGLIESVEENWLWMEYNLFDELSICKMKRKKMIVLIQFGVRVGIIGYGCGIVYGIYCWWVGCERMFLIVKEDLKVDMIC